MLLKFDKIISNNNYIEVSFDNGNTWKSYDKNVILSEGISFNKEDCNNDFSNIKIKGQFTNINDIAVKINSTEVTDISSGLGTNWGSSFIIGCSNILVSEPNSISKADLLLKFAKDFDFSNVSFEHIKVQSCNSSSSNVVCNDPQIIPVGYFRFSHTLENVTIPQTIKGICAEAFRCSSIKNVTINLPDSSDPYYIGGWAFADCHELKSVTFNTADPNKTYYIYFGMNIDYNSTSIGIFEYCDKLEELNIPSNVKVVCGYYYTSEHYLSESDYAMCSFISQDFVKATNLKTFDYRPFTQYCSQEEIDHIYDYLSKKNLPCYKYYQNSSIWSNNISGTLYYMLRSRINIIINKAFFDLNTDHYLYYSISHNRPPLYEIDEDGNKAIDYNLINDRSNYYYNDSDVRQTLIANVEFHGTTEECEWAKDYIENKKCSEDFFSWLADDCTVTYIKEN